MTLLNLIKAELSMLWGELKSYSFNYIFYNLSIVIMFVGLFYSNSNLKGNKALFMLFGLITWQLSSNALSYLANVIQDESLLGTLEQIFMTRTKALEVFLSKIIVSFIFTITKAGIIFAVCIWIFKVYNPLIHLGVKKFLIIIAIILLTVLSFYFLGLVFGGLSLYLKKIGAFINVLTYILLFFTGITSSVSSLPKVCQVISWMLPITWGGDCIKDVIFTTLTLHKMFMFLLIVVIYLLVGLFIFKMCIKKAKELGKLGQY